MLVPAARFPFTRSGVNEASRTNLQATVKSLNFIFAALTARLKLIYIPILSIPLTGFGYANGSSISSLPPCVFVSVGVGVSAGIVVAVFVAVIVHVLSGVKVLVEANWTVFEGVAVNVKVFTSVFVHVRVAVMDAVAVGMLVSNAVGEPTAVGVRVAEF